MSIRLIAEIVALIALLCGGWWYTEHERSKGAQECLNNDAKAVQKQKDIDAKILIDKLAETKREGQTYHEQITTPVVSRTLRLCVTPDPRSVSTATATGSSPTNATSVRTESETVPTVIEWDTSPLVQVGHNADAQVEGLISYIDNVCLKR